MSNHNQNKRRLALKALTGSAVAGGLIDKLPSVWQRPLVHGSVLPVHAQSSPEVEETGQVQLTVNNSGGQSETNQPLTYMIDRNSDGEITHIRIPTGIVSATGRVSASAAMDALLPAAYAQNSGSNFVVQQEFVINFANRLSASADLVFSLQIYTRTITCTISITAYLTQSRRELDRLVASPAECMGGDFDVLPVTGPDSGFSNDPNPPSTVPIPPVSIPEGEMRFEWFWGDGLDSPHPTLITGEFRIRARRSAQNVIFSSDVEYHKITISRDGNPPTAETTDVDIAEQRFSWDTTTTFFDIGDGKHPYFRSVLTPAPRRLRIPGGTQGFWAFYQENEEWYLRFLWDWQGNRFVRVDRNSSAPTIIPPDPESFMLPTIGGTTRLTRPMHPTPKPTLPPPPPPPPPPTTLAPTTLPPPPTTSD